MLKKVIRNTRIVADIICTIALFILCIALLITYIRDGYVDDNAFCALIICVISNVLLDKMDDIDKSIGKEEDKGES